MPGAQRRRSRSEQGLSSVGRCEELCERPQRDRPCSLESGTPLTIAEGLYDIGVLGYCAFAD